MNLNLTLFGQMITFALFIFFTMRFVWPPMIKALEDRKAKIADGLAAAQRGHKELELAQDRATTQLKEAKEKAGSIVEQASKQGEQIVDKAKESGEIERKRRIEASDAEIAQAGMQLREELRGEVGKLALAAAEKILARKLDDAANDEMLDELIKKI